jgi:hypothetical protein
MATIPCMLRTLSLAPEGVGITSDRLHDGFQPLLLVNSPNIVAAHAVAELRGAVHTTGEALTVQFKAV